MNRDDGDEVEGEVEGCIHCHGGGDGNTAVAMACMGGDDCILVRNGDDGMVVVYPTVEEGGTSCCDGKQHDGAPPHDNQPTGRDHRRCGRRNQCETLGGGMVGGGMVGVPSTLAEELVLAR